MSKTQKKVNTINKVNNEQDSLQSEEKQIRYSEPLDEIEGAISSRTKSQDFNSNKDFLGVDDNSINSDSLSKRKSLYHAVPEDFTDSHESNEDNVTYYPTSEDFDLDSHDSKGERSIHSVSSVGDYDHNSSRKISGNFSDISDNYMKDNMDDIGSTKKLSWWSRLINKVTEFFKISSKKRGKADQFVNVSRPKADTPQMENDIFHSVVKPSPLSSAVNKKRNTSNQHNL